MKRHKEEEDALSIQSSTYRHKIKDFNSKFYWINDIKCGYLKLLDFNLHACGALTCAAGALDFLFVY